MNAKITILGSGGSSGVPMIGNRWGVCDPNNPKNRRTRCSALISAADKRILIDTSADFVEQFNRVEVTHVDGVLFTHWHGDHINGFEELRYLYKRGEPLIPLYAEPLTRKRIEAKFPHMFTIDDPTGFYPLPVEWRGWDNTDMYGTWHDSGAVRIMPLELHHNDIVCAGYRIGDTAYCTDASDIKEATLDQLKGVKHWIVDCNNLFSDKGTVIHLNFDKIKMLNDIVQAPDVILTHLKNSCDYDTDSALLPDGYRLAYDGLEIAISE